jgi:hypothetical protein
VKKIVFVSDFFRNDIPGGAESNDGNLINYLSKFYEVKSCRSTALSPQDLDDCDAVIVSNFVFLPPEAMAAITGSHKYIIYEHDHKYVSTRDPSKFANFKIPTQHLINKEFYENASCVVVLSQICKEIMTNSFPAATVHNIGCSLWSDETFALIDELATNEKTKDLCVMKSTNPTKNYLNALEFCKQKNIQAESIQSANHHEFLKLMAQYEKFLFIPTVLETFSRICAEARMLNLGVMTNKKMIGFFSEDCSDLSGAPLMEALRAKNLLAHKFFKDKIEEICG